MNYIQPAVNNSKKGMNHNLNQLGMIIGADQKKLNDILLKEKLWFIDVPRTSSTHIKVLLGDKFGIPFGKRVMPGKGVIEGTTHMLLPPHNPAFFMQDFVGPSGWNTINSFTVVRNPYDWAVSFWLYSKMHHFKDVKNNTLSDFLNIFAEKIARDGVKENRSFSPYHYYQHDYVYSINNEVIVKNIFKFEERAQIDAHLNSIGIHDIPTEKTVTSNSEDYTPTTAEKNLIEKIFAKDFEVFNY